jgi:predicted dehydrogenase
MHSESRRMKIGILGAGGVVKDMHLPVLVSMPEVSISWICDKDKSRALQLSGLFGISTVFGSLDECTDVDIVLVAIPVGYRSDVMSSIFRRGWHAFCEKPFAVTRREHEKYLSEAYEHKVQVGVGYLRRYGPATLTARKIVGSGCFGAVSEVWASEGFRTKRTGKGSEWYLGDPKVVGGGVMMETGSHLVDQMCTILNISSFGIDTCTQWKYADLDFETRFRGHLSNNYQQNISAALEVSRLNDLCNGIFIQYQSFILKCGLFFQDSLEMITPEGQVIARLEAEKGAKTLGQALSLEWMDFIEQCRTSRSSFIGADTAIQSTAIIEKCYEIAEAGGNNENKARCVNHA